MPRGGARTHPDLPAQPQAHYLGNLFAGELCVQEQAKHTRWTMTTNRAA